MCMGGEFLLPCEPGELEIARLTIRSTTYDVLSVRAKRVKNRIRVRVDDEYDGETLNRKHSCISVRPLTLGRLIDLVIVGWDVFGYGTQLPRRPGRAARILLGRVPVLPRLRPGPAGRVQEHFRAHHEEEEEE